MQGLGDLLQPGAVMLHRAAIIATGRIPARTKMQCGQYETQLLLRASPSFSQGADSLVGSRWPRSAWHCTHLSPMCSSAPPCSPLLARALRCRRRLSGWRPPGCPEPHSGGSCGGSALHQVLWAAHAGAGGRRVHQDHGGARMDHGDRLPHRYLMGRLVTSRLLALSICVPSVWWRGPPSACLLCVEWGAWGVWEGCRWATLEAHGRRSTLRLSTVGVHSAMSLMLYLPPLLCLLCSRAGWRQAGGRAATQHVPGVLLTGVQAQLQPQEGVCMLLVVLSQAVGSTEGGLLCWSVSCVPARLSGL